MRRSNGIGLLGVVRGKARQGMSWAEVVKKCIQYWFTSHAEFNLEKNAHLILSLIWHHSL
jgi:hypothetical protein